MPPRALLGPTLQGLVLCALLLTGASVTTTPAAGAATSPNAVPVAAQALATRLGLTGAPVLGDQPQGYGGPWALWLTKVPVTIRTGPGTTVPAFRAIGTVLSVGPAGATGSFDYFVLPPGFPDYRDPYAGPPVSRTRAIRIVLAWLTKARVAIPNLPPHAKVETPGGTVLGGTGLCCYRELAVVYFSAGPDQPAPIFNAPLVAYVADGGAVVQVQVGGGRGVAPVPSRCQRRRGRDANGVPIGPACFDDQSAASDQLVVDIGGHEPWHADPAQLVRTFADGWHLTASPDQVPLRVVASTPGRMIYGLTARGASYQFTLIPAFPGLPGSVWQLVAIDHGP
jgi:hypothetical protein